eukprot:10802521-Prorocentrum_lima.AAC.1
MSIPRTSILEGNCPLGLRQQAQPPVQLWLKPWANRLASRNQLDQQFASQIREVVEGHRTRSSTVRTVGLVRV